MPGGRFESFSNKLRVQAVDEAGKPLARLQVELVSIARRREEGATKGSKQVTALRALSTNRDGFAIFSLDAIIPTATPAENLAVRFGRRPDLIFPISISNETGSQYTSYTLPLDTIEAAEAAPGPWLDDGLEPGDIWAIPGTFPDLGDLEFGDDRCGRLVPSDRTVRIVKQQQLVRTSKDAITCLSLGEDSCGGCGGLVEQGEHGSDRAIRLQAGEVIDYEIRCTRLGYTFGDLLYSLPLAPCESVTLAVSHWEQRQRARAEQQGESSEKRTAGYERENALAEAMNGASENSHRGWAVGGGASTGSGANFAFPGGIGTAALQASFGGTMMNTSDRGRIASNASRKFSDRIQSTAEAWRQDHQVVMMEQTETEDHNVSYRTVCNNNHCHVLNIFYHEVLANYRLSTKMLGHREVYFVPYKVKSFDLHLAICARPFLMPFLLEGDLTECYRKLKSTAKKVEIAKSVVDQFKLDLTVGFEFGEDSHHLLLRIKLRDGTHHQFPIQKIESWDGGGTYSYVVDTPNFDPEAIHEVGILKFRSSNHPLQITSFTVSAKEPGTGQWVRLGSGSAATGSHSLDSMVPASYDPPAQGQGEAAAADQDCAERLLAHLNCHKAYYNSLLWLLEDPNDRFCRFDRIQCGDTSLADLVLLEPLGVMGCHVAFAKSDANYVPYDGPPLVDERLLTLPTPGIFADAALGKCQACETIDPEVYWDWKDSPCVCGAKGVTLKDPESSSLFQGNPFPTLATGVWATGIAPPAGEAGANSLVNAFGAALAQAMVNSKDSASEMSALQDLLGKLTAALKDLLPKGAGTKAEGADKAG